MAMPRTTAVVQAAPRARSMTAGEWIRRATQLAEMQRIILKSRYCGKNPWGEEEFTVQSKSNEFTEYVIRVNPMRRTVACSCPAGQYGNPCGHAGAAWHRWSAIEKSMTEAAMAANRQYQDFADWLESRGY